MNSLDCKKPVLCPPEVELEKEIYPPATPEFTVCVGDYTLAWNGTRLYKSRSRTTRDGEYGSVTVVAGCITGYGPAEVPTYTPPYCNPNPAPCGPGAGGSSGASAAVSPAAGNQLSSSALGLYAKAYISAGAGVSIVGNGTQASPYNISATAGPGGGGVTQVVAGARIKVEELLPGQKTVSLREGTLAAGTYAGFSVDRYGFVTGYNAALIPDIIRGVVAGTDIDVAEASGIITVAHAEIGTAATYTVGDSQITVSNTGHVTGVEKLPPAAARRKPLIDIYRIEVRVPLPELPEDPVDFTKAYLEIEAYDGVITLTGKTVTSIASTHTFQLPAYITTGNYTFGVSASFGGERTTVTTTPAGVMTMVVTNPASTTTTLLARVAITIREA